MQSFKKKKKNEIAIFYVTVTLIPKSDEYSTKQENYRPTCFMNIDGKILKKILANRTQGCTTGSVFKKSII